MFDYMKFGPYICIGVILAVIFILWAFLGGQSCEFIGLSPLDPNTCGSYTGSYYSWSSLIPNNVSISESVQASEPVYNYDTIYNSEPVYNYEVPNNPEPVSLYNYEVGPDPAWSNYQEPIDNPPICLSEAEPVPTPAPVPAPIPRKKGRFVSRGERICCQTMENIYGVPFVTVRPKWLTNPETGYPMELDCYNDELKLAVEYNGEQHYKWPNFTNQSYDEFMNQVRRDKLKVDLCDTYGVYLITVPHTVKHDDIPNYIVKYLPEIIQKRIREESILVRNNQR